VQGDTGLILLFKQLDLHFLGGFFLHDESGQGLDLKDLILVLMLQIQEVSEERLNGRVRIVGI
jgi:hypothetical protein